jgi:hypothetical protein
MTKLLSNHAVPPEFGVPRLLAIIFFLQIVMPLFFKKNSFPLQLGP